MTTKTLDRNKIDLKAIIGPLDQKPEPKTLHECLAEAGGFPFAARLIISYGIDQAIPIGTEVRVLSLSPLYKGTFVSDYTDPNDKMFYHFYIHPRL